jgi:2-keto-4-pentenoate hydratase
MTPEGVAQAVAAMLQARRDMRPLSGLPEAGRPASFDEAYLIQDAFIVASGLGVGGWKIGCTSAVAQKMLNVTEPFFGPVFPEVIARSPAEMAASGFHMLALECEFAFRFGRDLPVKEAPPERDTIIAAVQTVIPAIEVISTRLDDFIAYGGIQIAADCGANGALILGREVRDWQGLDLDAHEVRPAVDGQEKARGTGAAVLGHPLNALIWFVHKQHERGRGLRTGEVITTGTCTGITKVEPEQRAQADFGDLGSVEVTFRR